MDIPGWVCGWEREEVQMGVGDPTKTPLRMPGRIKALTCCKCRKSVDPKDISPGKKDRCPHCGHQGDGGNERGRTKEARDV